MGFLFGFLMFLGTYLLIGPTMMFLYAIYNSDKKTNNERTKKTYFALGFIAAYVVLWIIFLNIGAVIENIGWTIIGAIGGLIGATITFNKNKDETVVNIDTNAPIVNNEPRGTELYFREIIADIERMGVDYLPITGVPAICEVLRYFDKQHVDYIINKYNPNLNILFEYDAPFPLTPLDAIGISTSRNDMFKYLLSKHCVSANYHFLLLFLVKNNKYDMVKCLLESHTIDLNKPLSVAIPEFEDDPNDPYTILDYAIDVQAHNLIQKLLQDHGARSFKIHF